MVNGMRHLLCRPVVWSDPTLLEVVQGTAGRTGMGRRTGAWEAAAQLVGPGHDWPLALPGRRER